MGAGVVQVFAFEVNLGAAGVFCEPLGMKQGRGPADVVLQVTVEPRLEVGVGLRLLIRRRELIERVHQRLGHEPAAERSEAAQQIRPVARPVKGMGAGMLAGVGSAGDGRGHRQVILRGIGRGSGAALAHLRTWTHDDCHSILPAAKRRGQGHQTAKGVRERILAGRLAERSRDLSSSSSEFLSSS